ncbi:hypothetical protein Y1Q_0003217 [Alligator mississippiensis]|uniref:Uncharacterized protein n=1 Tax=Alligator mississippiensis TaxID=8496 RepID=A0A151MDW2_ALLMI|nr:hypothetical protein Y1Q_0003217 [Alligator mississippiensis]
MGNLPHLNFKGMASLSLSLTCIWMVNLMDYGLHGLSDFIISLRSSFSFSVLWGHSSFIEQMIWNHGSRGALLPFAGSCCLFNVSFGIKLVRYVSTDPEV